MLTAVLAWREILIVFIPVELPTPADADSSEGVNFLCAGVRIRLQQRLIQRGMRLALPY